MAGSGSTQHFNQEQGLRIKTNKRGGRSQVRNPSKNDALRIVEQIRQKHNHELLMILEDEQRNEADRENKLK